MAELKCPKCGNPLTLIPYANHCDYCGYLEESELTGVGTLYDFGESNIMVNELIQSSETEPKEESKG